MMTTVGLQSLCTLSVYGIKTIREKQQDTRRSRYKPLALLQVDLLGFLTHSHTMTPFDAPGKQTF